MCTIFVYFYTLKVKENKENLIIGRKGFVTSIVFKSYVMKECFISGK